MCTTILRVKYTTGETKDFSVLPDVAFGEEAEGDSNILANRIDDLQAKDTVTRIEVFTRTRDIRRTTEWKDTLDVKS